MMTTRDVVVGSDTDVGGDGSQVTVVSYYDGGDDDVDGSPCVIVYLA